MVSILTEVLLTDRSCSALAMEVLLKQVNLDVYKKKKKRQNKTNVSPSFDLKINTELNHCLSKSLIS